MGLTTEPITLTARCRYYGGTNIARCNGKTCSSTNREEVAALGAAAKAIVGVAACLKVADIAKWTPTAKHLGASVWQVVYWPPLGTENTEHFQ